ncbi:MAG: hypothetical protein KF851_07705 [Pirellulaceae bacterium]|nr:hypothetical protein [Pirellulaceae bacterium]
MSSVKQPSSKTNFRCPQNYVWKPSTHRMLLIAFALMAVGVISQSELDSCHAFHQDPDDAAALSGFGPAEAQSLIDRPVLAAEDERVFRLFYRLLKLSDQKLEQTGAEKQQLAWLATSVGRSQFQLLKISGTVVSARQFKSPSQNAEDFAQYYRLELRDESGGTAVLFSLNCPEAWLKAQNLAEPVDFTGFFLGQAQLSESSPPVLVFVGKRVFWSPQISGATTFDPGYQKLAGVGFNLALLSEIDRHNRRPLSASEGHAFDQMHNAVSAIAAESQKANEEASITGADLFDLVRRPQQRAGDLVSLRGKVVKVTPIFNTGDQVGDRNIRPAYYQVELSIPLGETKISIDFDSGEQLLFQSQFPCTVVVPTVLGDPTNLTRNTIDVSGIMYRFWNYESVFAKQQGVQAGQIAPLVMATNLEVVPIAEPAGNFILWVILSLLMIIGMLAWFLRPRSILRRGFDKSDGRGR